MSPGTYLLVPTEEALEIFCRKLNRKSWKDFSTVIVRSQRLKLLVSEGLISAELIAKMRTWKHSGFYVYAGPTITDKEDAVRVGLYIVRAPASASRLQTKQVF